VLYGGILVRCLAFLGRFDEAAARGREVLRLAETSDRPLNLVHACSALGSVHLLKGNFDDAIVVLERGLQVCRVENFRIPFPALASALGTVYVGSGRIVEGLALLQEAVGPTTPQHHFVPAGLTNLGWGYLRAGQLDEATEVAARALALARERHDRGVEGYALRLLGEITAAADPVDVPSARERFQKALEIAQELEMRPLVALCYFGLGRLHGRGGDHAIARDHLARALRMFLDLDMPFYAEQSAAICNESGSVRIESARR
jgi:tetratricopeptide (TPR) repeat protein